MCVSAPILADLHDGSALGCCICEDFCPFVMRGCHFWQLLTVKDFEDVIAPKCFFLQQHFLPACWCLRCCQTQRHDLLTSRNILLCVFDAVISQFLAHKCHICPPPPPFFFTDLFVVVNQVVSKTVAVWMLYHNSIGCHDRF